MKLSDEIEDVDISPGVSMLGVLQYLNYKPWYALAEFVDNALESYLSNREQLRRNDSSEEPLEVHIEIVSSGDDRQVIVRDNAAGITASEYARAFRAATPPPPGVGLSEFGMGMKSAACWFAHRWQVRSGALGEAVERTVKFDMPDIVADGRSKLSVESRPKDPRTHFTEITLSELKQGVDGPRTLGKIKSHLRSIYREFLRQGVLRLWVKAEELQPEQTPVLFAAPWNDLNGSPVLWRKEIDFDFGLGVRVTGVAALRAVASPTYAGFALFRNGRLIQGSDDETYRPHAIFGNPNDYAYQRLFGELHLYGMDVSHTKDGFQWGENEEVFIELLKDHLAAAPMNLLTQADKYRARKDPARTVDTIVRAVDRTVDSLAKVHDLPLQKPVLLESDDPPEMLPQVERIAGPWRLELSGVPWEIELDLTKDPAVSSWVEIYDQPPNPGVRPRRIGIRVSLVHPFMERWLEPQDGNFEAYLRIAMALGISEVMARDAGVRHAGTFLMNVNELLRGPVGTAV